MGNCFSAVHTEFIYPFEIPEVEQSCKQKVLRVYSRYNYFNFPNLKCFGKASVCGKC